jgi:hypothetical protein
MPWFAAMDARPSAPVYSIPIRDPPENNVQTILLGQALPSGLRAFRDPSGRNETPLWLPSSGL